MRAYGFVDWSGNAGFKFALGSSAYLAVALVSSDDSEALRRTLQEKRSKKDYLREHAARLRVYRYRAVN
jgi:hypothetical protein